MGKRTKDAGNRFADRLAAFAGKLGERRLDAAVVSDRANVNALTGIDCDNACLLVRPSGSAVLHTDFRYVPAVERLAPWLKVADIRKTGGARPYAGPGAPFARVGFEKSVSYARYLAIRKAFPGARLADVEQDVRALRAVKTPWEIERLRDAARLNDAIWSDALGMFRPGMTEIEMARAARHMMIDRGEGEAFDTIVCVGANAAECHHVPDSTVWSGREPVLVDMGVKLAGYCSDMTRNIVPERASRLYRKVYSLVLEANMRAIEALRPGMKACELDAVARGFLRRNGFGREFGHSLGHGVGIEIHEAPAVARKQQTVLEPGMCVTIEPGVYLPGNLGVRIEDIVIVTDSGCDVLSSSAK